MKVRSHLKTVMLLVVCCTLVVTLGLLSGCKGKTGSAGTPGADGTSVSLNDCNNCHHLNSLGVTEFNETFVTGLAGADQTIPGGATQADRQATLTFDASKLPAGETAQTFAWIRTNGQVATIGTGTSSVLVTLPVVANYKTELTRHIKGLIVNKLSDGSVVSDRARIVPINPQNLDEASSATFKLRVGTASGKFYYTLVKVAETTGETAVSGFAAISTGLGNVPVGVPVLLRSKSTGTYNWTFTAKPATSALTVLNGPTTQFADFKPDVAGKYTISDGKVPANTFDVYAGTWKGVIVGQDANNRPTPDPGCLGCHDNQTAPDKFTPWKDSGHAEILTQNINDTASHWTISGCGPCHSVGYDTNAVNNGFDEAVATTGWTFTHGDPNNWTDMLTNFAPAARLANVQCENCHGPQDASGAHTTSASAAGPRTTMSADDCGICHGEPLRHARFQQWEDSGHGNFEVAVGEGIQSSSPNVLRSTCSGCHTAQGFLIYLAQLQAGNPLRVLPTNIAATKDTVLPITCQVCHDPHAQGTTSGEPNTAKVRLVDNTPKLTGGFAATGVGRGAICFICHNSRNGQGAAPFDTDTFLHQDGDPQFGNLTSYAGAHHSSQGDMVMGYNGYFVGSGNYRSPHSLIIDTCTNCHMEQTPPPALLSYNLGGTNHGFVPSLGICKNCHSANVALGPMLQEKVQSQLEMLEKAIADKIMSRNTVTNFFNDNTKRKIVGIRDLGDGGTINVILSDVTGTVVTAVTSTTVAGVVTSVTGTTTTGVLQTGTVASASLSTMLGIRICTPTVTTNCLETDALAKALWNFYLVETDASFGVHNPDFTFAILSGALKAVNSIPDVPVPSNEL